MLHHLLHRRRAGIAPLAVQERGAKELHPIIRHDGRLLHQALSRVDHDLARAERLPRDVRRTRGSAPTALGARVAVEQVLPRELLDVRRSERLDVRLEIHVPHHPLLPRAARVGEVHVDERRDDVEVLRVRQIVQEDEDQQRMHPPEHVVARVRGGG
jgi:hypothetical protein